MILYAIQIIILTLLLLIPLLIVVAFYTLSERKLMASIQRRSGPTVVGFYGLLQPFSDGLKLIGKETVVPTNADRLLFIIGPGYTFFFSLISWAFIPFSKTSIFIDKSLGLLFVFAISSLGVYGIIAAGWASNSTYSFLGAIRASTQILAYELPLSVILSTIGLISGSFNLTDIVESQRELWFCLPLLPACCMFLIIILMETNRTPADLPESESELVAGFNVDYSAIGFALFFLGEYSSMLVMSEITVLLFFGGWLFPTILDDNSIQFISPEVILAGKTTLIAFYFVWVRATMPRVRYDFLMNLCWKKLLPFSFGFFFFLATFLFSLNGLPTMI